MTTSHSSKEDTNLFYDINSCIIPTPALARTTTTTATTILQKQEEEVSASTMMTNSKENDSSYPPCRLTTMTNKPPSLLSLSSSSVSTSSSSLMSSAPTTTTTTTTASKTNRRQRMVKFSNLIKVRLTPHTRQDFTAKEWDAYWYSKSEYEMIKKEMFGIISIMKKVVNITSKNKNEGAEILRGWEEQNSSTICIRGLESRTSQEAKKKIQRRQRAINVVLDEQENYQNEKERQYQKQQQQGNTPLLLLTASNDHVEKIARLYQACTLEAVLDAQYQGQRDQQSAAVAVAATTSAGLIILPTRNRTMRTTAADGGEGSSPSLVLPDAADNQLEQKEEIQAPPAPAPPPPTSGEVEVATITKSLPEKQNNEQYCSKRGERRRRKWFKTNSTTLFKTPAVGSLFQSTMST